MIPANLISKKRDGHYLSKNELSDFINNYLTGFVTEEQMAAMLMAIYFKGMNEDEILKNLEKLLGDEEE